MSKLTPADTAFPSGSLVLVTGASGFMASHIIEQLLLTGYHVRGTVRNEDKAASTTEFFSARHGAGKFSAIVVPELSAPGAFDETLKGVQGVIHTASDTSFSPDPNVVIPPTIAGVTSLLKAASKESSIKSFVYTSSSVACAGAGSAVTLDASTWNEAHIKEAWSITSAPFPPSHAGVVYSASKAEGEKAFWKFVEEEKPHFRANSVLPDANFGEVLNFKGTLSTGAWIRMVYENGVDFVQHLPPQCYVNVADTGRLHVAALLSESVKNERIFASASPFTWNQVLAILRNLYPTKKFADDLESASLSKMVIPTKREEQLLRDVFGREGYTSLEETIADNLKGLA